MNFRWEDAGPAPTLAKDTFSVRWTGSVVPRYSETYTFYTQSNDGVRLWVDGKLLINDWTIHSTTENRGTLTLQAGRAYSLRLEFYENLGLATMRLYWSSPSQRKGSSQRSGSGPRLPSRAPGSRASRPLIHARDCGTKRLSFRSEVAPFPART